MRSPITLRIFATICTALLLVAGPTQAAKPGQSKQPADNKTAGVGTPTGLTLLPGNFTLQGKRARQQLIVTGKYGSTILRDLTQSVKLTSSDPSVAKITGSIVRPVANGQAVILASVGKLTVAANVTVSKFDQPSLVSFKNEMLPALSKAGCNAGACHGSPSGKAGFRLSLRAFDPTIDILTLRQEFYGRRTNIMKPDASLLLKKPLMEVGHGGGRRLIKGDPIHRVMRGWIAEGQRIDLKTGPRVLRIETVPKKRILRDHSDRQQLFVLAHYSDGSVRDVTALTVFSSSNESVGSVDGSGLVEKTGRGETAVLARYLDMMETSHITFLEKVPGFAWNNPRENNFVDKLAFAKLKQLQILPSELCTDPEFLRRVYLDTTGRLPSIKETQAFLSDKDPKKRGKLIDKLIDSADFAAFWTMKWADILRSNSKKMNGTGVHKFRQWIYNSIRHDQPVDKFVRQLITASGSAYENPAVNYWRASRDPNDATETTAQLFLGIRIQCAKCHNHPFERWSQDNYYGIAAAFTRIGRKKGVDPTDEIVFVKSSGEITQPRTGQKMKVHLLLKGDVDVPANQDRRVVFAKWLTAANNPFFAKASVNRIWGHLMGRGIVEPVDDFRDSNPPSNEILLNELAAQFVKNKFSRKWAVKTIMKSRLYQLSSRKNKFNADDEIYASHANTRLLGAEQLLDAICAVTAVPEKFKGMPIGTRATQLVEPPKNHYFLKIFGQPQREMACGCERSNESNLSQALQMINGPVVHNKLRDGNGRIAKMIASKKTDDEIITTLYLAALSRKPVAEEMSAAKKHIANSKKRKESLEDIGWAILNSKEFLFQH